MNVTSRFPMCIIWPSGRFVATPALLLALAVSPSAAAAAIPRTAAGDSSKHVATASTPVITAQVLRRACLRLWTSAAAADAQGGLVNFCEAEVDEDPGESLKLVDASVLARVPEIALELPEADWQGYRGRVHQKEGLIFQNPQQAGGPAGGRSLADLQSAVIWGFADFVAGKAKEQADVYLVQRYIGRICTEREGKLMLPSTCTQLGSVNSLVDAVRMPSLLRTAARADATIAPVVLTHLVLARNPDLLKQHLDPSVAGEMMIAGLFASIAGKPWEQALGAMASDDLVGARSMLSLEAAPVASMLYIAGLLSRSLDMPVKTVPAEFTDAKYGALWAQRAMVVNLKLGRPFPSPTLAGREIWDCEARAATNPYCSMSTGSRISLKLFDGSRRVAPWVDSVRVAADSRRRANALARLSTEVLSELGTMAALAGRPISTTPVGGTWNQVNAIVRAYADEQHATAAMLLLQLPDSMGLQLNIPANAVRGLTLTATLADADSASDVVSTLNTLVAGSRTYMHKRTKANGFSLGVNAYAGGNAGWETVVKGGSAKSKASSFAGAFVPLGLELAWPTEVVPKVRSFSVLLQAIDVGALTSWRFQSAGDVDQEPRVSAAQVFSPGIHAVFGFSGIPLSLGVGVSIAPRIRQVTTNGITEQKSALRVPVFLAMDIPLFP
ncbi:MAG TPA: hypothetical protein VGD77_09555 [Gemmatimonadaceae bacterium]